MWAVSERPFSTCQGTVESRTGRCSGSGRVDDEASSPLVPGRQIISTLAHFKRSSEVWVSGALDAERCEGQRDAGAALYTP